MRLPHGLGDEVNTHAAVAWDVQAYLQARHKVWYDAAIVPAGELERLRVDIRRQRKLTFRGPPTNAETNLFV